ncbi:MAG: hypothetical protein RIC04_02990 [Parvibaculum sp.]|uniref:hypothetical protein n=1 Tax=Parvibaculum sp. TaxID=2024848 RepID=UPI0032EFA0C4
MAGNRRRDGAAQYFVVHLMRRIGGGERRAVARNASASFTGFPGQSRMRAPNAVSVVNSSASASQTRRERRAEMPAGQRLAAEGSGDGVCVGHFRFPQAIIVIPAKAEIHGRMQQLRMSRLSSPPPHCHPRT